jgi:hypothetical protein
MSFLKIALDPLKRDLPYLLSHFLNNLSSKILLLSLIAAIPPPSKERAEIGASSERSILPAPPLG